MELVIDTTELFSFFNKKSKARRGIFKKLLKNNSFSPLTNSE